MTTTNVYHFRELLAAHLTKKHGAAAGKAVEAVILREIMCYAFKLHSMRGLNLLKPDPRPNRGYVRRRLAGE